MDVFPLKAIFFDLGDTLVRKVPGTTRREWIEGVKEGLVQLGEKGVRLGLLSNTGNLTRSELFDDLLPLDFKTDMFEEELIILSSEVGVVKPRFGIFAHAVDRAGLAPVECLFCTEELSHVLAAQEIGMRAAWVQSGGIKRLADKLIEADPPLLVESG